jgi:hypothetical protein
LVSAIIGVPSAEVGKPSKIAVSEFVVVGDKIVDCLKNMRHIKKPIREIKTKKPITKNIFLIFSFSIFLLYYNKE